MTKISSSLHIYAGLGPTGLPKNTATADNRQRTLEQTAQGMSEGIAPKSQIKEVFWRSRLLSLCITKNNRNRSPNEEAGGPARHATRNASALLTSVPADRLTSAPADIQMRIVSMLSDEACRNYRLLNTHANSIVTRLIRSAHVDSPESLERKLQSPDIDRITLLSIAGHSFTDANLEALPATLTALFLKDCIQVTDQGVSTALQRLPALQKLSLSGCQNLTSQGLAEALQDRPNLQHLDLSGCRNLTDQGLAAALHNKPDLQHLNLSGCRNLTDHGLVEALQNKPNLQHLSLSGLERLLDYSLVTALANKPNLQHLDLSGCLNLTDRGLDTVLQDKLNVHHLNLSGCRNLSFLGINTAIQNQPNIKHLDLSRCRNLTELGLAAALRNKPDLEYLNLSRCPKLSGFGLAGPLQERHNLRYLDLSACRNLTSQGLAAALRNKLDLQHLHLSENSQINDQDLATALLNVPNLRHINLSRCAGLRTINLPLHHLEDLDVSNCDNLMAIQPAEGSFPALAHLNLSSCNRIDSTALNALLKSCPSLGKLNISFCENLAEVALSGMNALENVEASHCTGLTTLRLENHPALKRISLTNNESLVNLIAGNLPALEELDLSRNARPQGETNSHVLNGVLQNAGTNLKLLNLQGRIPSDETMPDLRLFAGLNQLDISNANISGSSLLGRLPRSLKTLKISDTGITDRHLSDVLRMQRHLEHLDVHRSNNLTSAGLRPLRRNFPFTLQHLDVRGCQKLTVEAISKLQAVIPNVIFDE